MNIEIKINKAIKNNRLKLVEGQKSWYNYMLSISKMVWVRNLFDGYQIDIFHKKTMFLLNEFMYK